MPHAAEAPKKASAVVTPSAARSARLLVPSVEQLGQIMTLCDLVRSSLFVSCQVLSSVSSAPVG